MATTMAGEHPTLEKKKDRVTLSVRSPLVTSLLAGLGVEKDHMEALRAFANGLLSDRNRFDIERRKSGLFGGGKLSRAAAERAWSRAFDGEGAQ